jgi:iron complex outermembrane recepter protein
MAKLRGNARSALRIALVPLLAGAAVWLPATALCAPTSDNSDQTPTVKGLTVQPGPTPYSQLPGAVVGDITPEIMMDQSDIQSYGVSTVTELLNELAPQTRSDRGRTQQSPVILINGRRISAINEVQNIPTEAILRVDILPEEVSLKYGYTADQRVINFVLKPEFRAVTGEGIGGATTEGGDDSTQAEVDQFKVDHDTRLNMDLKYQYSAGLTYAQRDLESSSSGAPFADAGNVTGAKPGQPIDPTFDALVGEPVTVAGIPAGVTAGDKLTLQDFAPFANKANVTDTASDFSLAPATQTATANVVAAQPLAAGINATFNATVTGTTSDSLQGLPGVSLMVPAGDPFSPFSSPVNVDRFAAGVGPLQQNIDGWTAHLGTTFNRDVGDWRLSLTSAYNHSDTITETGAGLNVSALQTALNADSPTFNPFAPLPHSALHPLPNNSSRAIQDGGNIQLLANGPLVKLPAGALYVSAKLGDVEAVANSSSDFAGISENQVLARNDASAQLNVDVPLTSRKNHVLALMGDSSVFVNSAIDELSDFGPLVTLGGGLNWTPIPGYNLIVSTTHDHQAPTLQQLDGPLVETPGTHLFDYSTGQTVTVTQVTGGNADLKADDRTVYKVGLTLKPFQAHDLTFTANYINSHIDSIIETFPSASAAIEAAFPNRFIRNGEGQLIEDVDTAVNFADQDRTELRWGINFTMPVGKQPPPPQFSRRNVQRRNPAGGQAPGGSGGPPTSGAGDAGIATGTTDNGGQTTPTAPGSSILANAGSEGGAPSHLGGGGYGGGGFGGRGGRGGGLGGGQPTGGRFQFAVYHTIYFQDQFRVAPGGPLLDLLDGAAAGNTGGQYRDEIEGQMGYTDNGFGARLSADWRSPTTVIGGGAMSSGTLNFSDITTINLRLWNDFTPQKELVARYPFLRGLRVTFSITNLFNQSISVRDTAGATPLIYESNFLDPTGRVVAINLRKLFD